MKTLKFFPELSQMIKSGAKTTTWRLFDDKDLQVGDKIILATRDGDSVTNFGKAEIVKITMRTIETIQEEDYEGHEPSKNPLEDYRKYYGNKILPNSEVKVIKFKVLEINQ